MSFKRLVLGIACLLLCLGWSVTAQSKKYSLSQASGLQIQIGGGLPLPIQVQQTTGGTAMNPTNLGTHFPPLLVHKRAGPVTVSGTTTNTAHQKLIIPANVLTKQAAQKTLGQFGQNPSLYAVATNLAWAWPTQQVTLSTGARTGAKTVTYSVPSPSSIRYSNPLATKFGGPAQFSITGQMGQGVMPSVAVTIYGIAKQTGGVGNPPCTHTKLVPPFPGTYSNPACIAGLGQAVPTGVGVIGGPAKLFASTPGGTSLALQSATKSTSTKGTGTNGPGPYSGVGLGKFGPNGTVSFFYQLKGPKNPPGTGTNNPPGTSSTVRRGFTNMASSWGYPWTTGKLTLKAPNAKGAKETFTITGKDMRTPKGSGTIQLVAGSLSLRSFSLDNANRGWVRLVLVPVDNVPALSPGMRVAAAVLMLLAFGYAVRRRFSA